MDLPREEAELEPELDDPLELLDDDELEELERPLLRRSGDRFAALLRSGLLLRVAALDFFAKVPELELEPLLRRAILISSASIFYLKINKHRQNNNQ